MNLVDLIFVVFIGFYAYRGFHRGLVREGFDLVGFGFGIALALKLYPYLAIPFKALGLPDAASKIIGGGLIFLLFVVGSALLAGRAEKAMGTIPSAKPMKVGGAAFASVWSTLFAVFMMIVITVIPSPRSAQVQVRDSLIGRTVFSGESRVYPLLEDYAKHEARNLLFYLRQYFTQLDPPEKSDHSDEEFFELQPSADIDLDPRAEIEILALVNEERVGRGLRAVKLHVKVRGVARGHSADMYRRGYFSHVTPDGIDPFERIERDRINFTYAGENLALAPTVTMVHQGLMNSPRHKDNILKPEFTDVGIGVFRGPYGLMVTQNFCAGCRE